MGMETGWLWFWRAKPGKAVGPEAAQVALQEGEEPADLEDLPVDDILAALKKQYPGFDPKGEDVGIDLPEEESAIEPAWSRKHFYFTFYGDPARQMDRVVGLMRPFGLDCYDEGARQLHPSDGPPPNFQGTPEERAFFDALDRTLSKAADDACAATDDPQERLKRLNAFLRSGAAEQALDKELGRPAKKPKKRP